jgi:eukaryotic-like serine/threonine-protein kinase
LREGEREQQSAVAAAKIAVVAAGGQPKTVIEDGAVAFYVSTGHIIYLRGGSIMAVPFDADRLEVTGRPVTVTAGGMVNRFSAEAQYAVSPAGTLVYAPGGPLGLQGRTITLIDRHGTPTSVSAPERFYAEPSFAPDGRSLALTVRSANDDVWIYYSDRAAFSRRTTASLGSCMRTTHGVRTADTYTPETLRTGSGG